MGSENVSSGMQYLSRGLLNEDEALKIILGKQSFGGSGSSSAVETPIGSPKGKLKEIYCTYKTLKKVLFFHRNCSEGLS